MGDDFKPAGYTSVAPYLVVAGADRVIDFLVQAFGAERLRQFEHEDGGVLHAEVRIDDTVVMVGDAGDAWEPTPCHVHVYVPDVDAAYRKALDAGAASVEPPNRKGDDEDRRGGVKGPGGVTWWVSTREID